jgi:hypothetical protein
MSNKPCHTEDAGDETEILPRFGLNVRMDPDINILIPSRVVRINKNF